MGMKRLSSTGCVFSAVFLALAIWCLVGIARGDGDPMWILNLLTLPMSYLVVLLSSFVHPSFGLSNDMVDWSGTILDVLWGMLMFYFFGWLLERPLRH